MLDDRPGLIVFKASGKGAEAAFQDEAGGHRWQRIPETEKRGRVHTSTVTVAVLSIPTATEVRVQDKDLEWKTCRGSGAGGQHRNKTDSAVQLTHLPTGVSVRCESERSQHDNRRTALEILRSRLFASQRALQLSARSNLRKSQIGSGMRGDKRRTIRVQDGTVTDHITGKSTSYKKYAKGFGFE